MAAARQRAEWLRVGVIVADLASCWSGQKVDPLRIIPPPYRPVVRRRVKTEAEVAVESAAAWKLLDRFFGGDKHGRARGSRGK